MRGKRQASRARFVPQFEVVNNYDRVTELGSVLESRLAEIRFPLAESEELEIRRHVCEYTKELRCLGVPPKRIILAVRFMASQAAKQPTLSRFTAPDYADNRDELIVQMVHSCIEHAPGPRLHSESTRPMGTRAAISGDTQNAGGSTAAERARLVLGMATGVFGDGIRAEEWLANANELFDGDTPLLVAKGSVTGYGRVCQYLEDLTKD